MRNASLPKECQWAAGASHCLKVHDNRGARIPAERGVTEPLTGPADNGRKSRAPVVGTRKAHLRQWRIPEIQFVGTLRSKFAWPLLARTSERTKPRVEDPARSLHTVAFSHAARNRRKSSFFEEPPSATWSWK
ncbi:hypothetical protein KM043_016173 [Ampulex compressa]|nr:hypothetical protein KM043_016173 [Ampulex compressa]